MPSDRVQRRVDAALDEADAALDARDWATVRERAEFALTLDPNNQDALSLREAAERGLGATSGDPPKIVPGEPSQTAEPSSFAGGRYRVERFLGEGGKKRVYLAHDELLDHDMKYRVFVDDNFHYMDESERYELGQFETLDAAVDACKEVVDEFLRSAHSPGMTEDELVEQYVLFGDDPFVYVGDGTVPFSARDYARRRAAEICREN